MTAKKLYLQSTEVPARTTITQIIDLLVRSGARQLLQEYNESGELCGLRYSLDHDKHTEIYHMPVRVEPVYKILCAQRGGSYNEEKLRQQAERIAWRLLYRWLQAQLAFIEVGMVDLGEVMLGFREGQNGHTFWELVQSGGRLALPAARES